MSEYSPAFDFVMNHEDPHRTGTVTEDAGGRTRFGIAQKFHPELPESFFTGPADAALKTAEEILRRDYWDPMRLAELHDQKLANKLFDMAVNMGVHQATIYAQRAVNGLIIAAQALNTSGAAEMPEQPELVAEDGVIGPRTLTALNAADPAKLYAALVRVVAPALRTRRGHQSGASKESVGMAEEGRSVEQLAISN